MSYFVIQVKTKSEFFDAIGKAVKDAITSDLGIKNIEKVEYADVYKISGDFVVQDIEKLAKQLFSDAISHEFTINKSPFSKPDWEITVWLHPDVTDNVGLAAELALQNLIGEKATNLKISSARKYAIYGKISKNQAEKISTSLLANELIETVEIRKGA